ncbi:hypothetical protein Kpol_538p5 [Vanderwaltozyma polyspora DSM 70294]|uniref:RING-type domain-containing protein n=1 Tax=Vanderwaltozyma polyspora (strain ATCC 22028 / DSM 70294 / BCRC 21397 / CBS 2163 / NBRC 10782 / NRRL Y-8283 / UCD 57-17) TaxID=436907 RepID=A7TKB8_VANPO|nr:uncharacterized protein Kpol_538p5 [Vanderwaltozyma polyspora DSM 70294]EDO17245.1 hypothetical protein Kpol_538p5 [Vanderwaltozyma polyspora DSM 70294]
MSDLECAICFEEFKEDRCALNPCHHTFHLECIRIWHSYADDLKCPTCRTESETITLGFEGVSDGYGVIINLRDGFYVRKLQEFSEMTSVGQTPQIITDFNINQEVEEEEDNDDNEDSGDDHRLKDEGSGVDVLVNEMGELSITENTVRVPSTTRILQCNICGEIDESINECCDDCNTLYHDHCLRSLAIEIFQPQSWELCVQCNKKLGKFNMPGEDVRTFNPDSSKIVNGRLRDKNSLATERIYHNMHLDEFETLRTVKYKIQEHVRNVLNDFKKRAKNKGISISTADFIFVNKFVSRNLYQISEYKYKANEIDYDGEAKKQVLHQLILLGYTNI